MAPDGKDSHAAVPQVDAPSATSRWVGLIGRLRGRPFARAVATLAGATALAQAISFAASPLLTRLYTPDDFGIASVFVSLLSLAVGASALRYDLAIPLPDDDTTARALLSVSLSCVLLTSAVVGAAVTGWGDRLVVWTNTPGLEPFLWLLVPAFLVAGVHQVLTFWAVRARAYGRLARTRLSRNLGAATAQCILGVAGAGPMGLLVGELIGQGAGTATLAALARRRGESAGVPERVANALRAARAYYRFPVFLAGSSLLNSGGLFLPPILLARGYGAEAAGLFALAQRILEAPVRLVGLSISQVYLAEAAAVAREDAPRLAGMYFGTAKKLFVVGSIPVLAGGLVSPWLFGILFGADWSEAGTVAQALSWYVAVRFVAYPLSQTLNILGRQGLQMASDVFRFVAVLTLIPIGGHLGLPAIDTVRLFALGMGVSYLVLFLMGARAVSRASHGKRQSAETAPTHAAPRRALRSGHAADASER